VDRAGLAALPLRGVRILEPAQAYAVPHGTRLLAALGAEVIKIESRARPDTARVWPFPDNRPGREFWNQSGIFHEPNRNKLGTTIDLASAGGKALFLRLVAVADVVAENFTPRVMRQFGLGCERLRSEKPDLIMVSSTGYGHSGPWTNYSAWGSSLEPTTGLSELTGYADGPPRRAGIAYTDMPAALVAATAVLAALRHRALTGEGQWIDLAQYEVGVTMIGEAVLDYELNGRVQTRIGNRHPTRAPQGVYPCRPPSPAANDTGWLALSVGSDREWRSLCRVIGAPALATDRRFATVVARRHRADEIDARVAAWTCAQDARAAAASLQDAGVAASAVFTNKDLLTDRHLAARGFFAPVVYGPASERMGTRPYPDLPFRFEPAPEHGRRPAPRLGEHNDYVFGELLGLGRAELAALRDAGVIGEAPLVARQTGPPPRVIPLESMKEAGLLADYDPDFYDILGLPRPQQESADDPS
jgi:crotonobetainyl-CoA:carnitine CoA-transferase CaiB-like acyl-CoA transferase